MKTRLSTLLVSMLLVAAAAACGGSPRGAATAASASNGSCADRIRAAMKFDFVEPDSPAARKQLDDRLWLAQNCPTHDQTIILGGLSGESAELGAAWKAQADAHPDDAVVQENYAFVLTGRDDATALAVLARAEAKWPDEMRWPQEQAHILSRSSRRGTDADLAAKAYAKLQRAEQIAPADRRFDLLGELATLAFEAGRMDDARRYANEVLAGIGARPKSWNTGNLIHEAHTVLGRIALRDGDIAGAKAHLLAAGKTPGSPQLDSFGPDFSLAVELLDKGERTAVDEYLALVDVFWEMGKAEVANWRAQLARGESPRLR